MSGGVSRLVALTTPWRDECALCVEVQMICSLLALAVSNTIGMEGIS
jgi:hypothetical protein